jgi:hypothetical protein
MSAQMMILLALRHPRSLPDRVALGRDDAHEFVPRFDERLRALILKLDGKCIDIDSGFAKAGENFFAIPTVGRESIRARCAALALSTSPLASY